MPGGDVTGAPAIGIGLIGKLPAHGDFVRRGQPAAVLALIDRWLDRELGAAVSAGIPLDEAVTALDGAHGAFAHDGGIVLAALVASGDGVGRRFPLVATLTGAAAGPDAAKAWCAAAADALAAARDGGDDADAALSAVAAITPPAWAGDIPTTGWWRGGDATADGGAAADGAAADATPTRAAADRDADADAAPNAAPPTTAPATPVPAANEADGDATLPLADATPVAPAKRWWRLRRDDATTPAPATDAIPPAALPTGAAFRALLAEARA